MITNHVHMDVLAGALSQKVTLSVASAQSATISQPTNTPAGQPVNVMIVADVPFWVRYGSNPTALADGKDQYWPANTPLRTQVAAGGKFAFIAGGAGAAYITPGC